jgi:threonine/homoserine/homoserine lactone efflux protein
MLTLVLAFVIGFVTSIPPMGPIAILVLQQSLMGHHLRAIALSVGGSIAEGVYCAAAIWGLDLLLEEFPTVSTALQWMGVVVLVVLGGYFARPQHDIDDSGLSKVDSDEEGEEGDDGEDSEEEARQQFREIDTSEPWHRGFLVGLSIEIVNPTLLATWTSGAAVLVSLVGIEFGTLEKIGFPLALIVGINAWFVLLVFLVRKYGARLDVDHIHRLVRFLGVVLIGLGVFYGIEIVTSSS